MSAPTLNRRDVIASEEQREKRTRASVRYTKRKRETEREDVEGRKIQDTR